MVIIGKCTMKVLHLTMALLSIQGIACHLESIEQRHTFTFKVCKHKISVAEKEPVPSRTYLLLLYPHKEENQVIQHSTSQFPCIMGTKPTKSSQRKKGYHSWRKPFEGYTQMLSTLQSATLGSQMQDIFPISVWHFKT